MKYMTTLYPTHTKQITNILFPKQIIEPYPSSLLMRSVLSHLKPEILHINSVFPFDPFSDSLIVDADTVTIIHRFVPPIEHIETIPIEVITDVKLNRGLMLSSLVITAANLRNPITISIAKLKPQDATCAHRIIECLMAMKHKNSEKPIETPCEGVIEVLH